jgi:hypothetical protein
MAYLSTFPRLRKDLNSSPAILQIASIGRNESVHASGVVSVRGAEMRVLIADELWIDSFASEKRYTPNWS